MKLAIEDGDQLKSIPYLLAQRLAENSDKPVGKRQNLG